MKRGIFSALLASSVAFSAVAVPQAQAVSVLAKHEDGTRQLCTVKFTSAELEQIGVWYKQGAAKYIEVFELGIDELISADTDGELDENLREIVDVSATKSEMDNRIAAGENFAQEEIDDVNDAYQLVEDTRWYSPAWGTYRLSSGEWAANVGDNIGDFRFALTLSNRDAAQFLLSQTGQWDSEAEERRADLFKAIPVNRAISLTDRMALLNEGTRAVEPQVNRYQTDAMNDAELLVLAPADYAETIAGLKCGRSWGLYTSDHVLQARHDFYVAEEVFPKSYFTEDGQRVEADGVNGPYAGMQDYVAPIIERGTVDRSFTMRALYRGLPQPEGTSSSVADSSSQAGIAVGVIAALAAIAALGGVISQFIPQIRAALNL